MTSLLLGACNDEDEALKEEPKVTKPQEEVIVIPTLTDETFFETVYEKLTGKGYVVSEPHEADIELFGAETGMTLELNGETLMPLHLYKLASSDERLQQVEKTGYLDVSNETQRDRLAVKRINNFIIYLHKGHPDYEQVMEAIDEL